jgi:threonyl-tRNA synthetase
VVGIPVAADFNDYLSGVAERLRAAGVRVEVDTSDDRMQKKIRTAQQSKVPFMLIAGGEDAEAGAVSFRFRDGRQQNKVPVDEAVAIITDAIRDRVQV